MFSGGVRCEREVEEDQAQAAAAASRRDADVAGLDVPVGDALLLQVVEGLQQILTEAPHEVERGRLLVPQTLGQDTLAGLLHQECRPAANLASLDETHDVGVVQAAQDLCFGAHLVAVRLVHRHLQHQLVFTALRFDQQGVRGAAAPEPSNHFQSTVEPVSRLGQARIDGRDLFLRACLLFRTRLLLRAEFAFGQGQVFEELAGRGNAVTHQRCGGERDQVLQVLAHTIDHLGGAQPAARLQPLGERERVLGGRMSGEEVIGDRTEREDIGFGSDPAVGQRLGRQIDLRGVFDLVLEVARAGGDRRCRPAAPVSHRHLPVHDLQADRGLALASHHHVLRRQAAMAETMPVRVAQRLGQLAQQAQPLFRAEFRQVLGEKPVEALCSRIMLEDQRRAQLGLLEVERFQDAWMVDPLPRPGTPGSPCGPGARAPAARRHGHRGIFGPVARPQG